MRRLLLLLTVVGCGDDGARHTHDACVAGTPTVTVTQPAMFTCHQNYTANVMLTNNTCAPLVVQSVNLSAVTTTGQCVPPSAAMYAGSTVGAGQTTAVLDLKTNPFCCTSPGCPASFQCDETYTFDVVTASGTFTGSATTHLSLDSCDVICP